MSSSDAPTSTDSSLGPKIRLGVLVSAIGIGIFMSTLDATIVVIVLEKIKSFYDVTSNKVQWIILAYLLIIMALTIIAGDLGDKFGNKLVFQIGMVLFSLGSAFCFMAAYIPLLYIRSPFEGFAFFFSADMSSFTINSFSNLSSASISSALWWMVLARVVQALGATGMTANGMAIITRFTTKKNRGTAVGINNLLISISVVIGPVFGAIISDYFHWGGVFLINVPLGLIGFIWVQRTIPKAPPIKKEKKADYVGSILFALFLTTLILSFTIFVDIDVEDAKMWAGISLLFSIMIFPVFILWERRATNPLIDLSMLKNRKISIGLFTAIMKHQGYIVIIYLINLYLQEMGIITDIIRVGLVISGLPVGMALMAAFAGKLSNTVDARILCTIATVCVTVLLVVLAIFIDISAPIWFYVITASLIGLSIGLFMAPNANSIMSAAPKEKLGIASGLHGLTTSIGINLGIALSTLVFTLSGNILSKSNGYPAEALINYVPSMK
ncbi:MAG: MFS transporter, partial [Candidatus Heimdallarchaeaceae archaeon]